ncbi:hypothetical protein SAICODRAFT_21800 [Saitoella complicata NRRL Y-17804]|uniref:Uncharacterized protein n=1 Tax=Saitoella complicata (strain BCRC 22490 / CBS 7301 / JCM 7358 / NBRC 10748 / NRRL Y-17804) TaxID=698492 RepID=A0A0E9NQG8_SAICN|nr:uncharacterized protein SAICODRAFT_21800 [Saitoella complicata NRRL Y-17804]ODQ50313.1 hypothetical protein SAICODRAFT_21800 [Saitoella complicata NRRL Y-17804]GAO52122.1 hypothetical protein G7K_6208-t1 [Saitoella complicata NRRL Y-17804]
MASQLQVGQQAPSAHPRSHLHMSSLPSHDPSPSVSPGPDSALPQAPPPATLWDYISVYQHPSFVSSRSPSVSTYCSGYEPAHNQGDGYMPPQQWPGGLPIGHEPRCDMQLDPRYTMRSAIGDDYLNGPGSTETSGWRSEETGSHCGGTQTPGSTTQQESGLGISDYVRTNPYWMNADKLEWGRAPRAAVPVNNAENPQGSLSIAQDRDQVGNLLDPAADQRNGVHNTTPTWMPESAARMHASMYGRPPSWSVAPPPRPGPPPGFQDTAFASAAPEREIAPPPGFDIIQWIGEAHEPGFNAVVHNVAEGEPTKTPPVEFVPADRPLKVQYPLSAMMGGVERELDAEESKFVMVCYRLTELLGMFKEEMENPVLKVKFGKEMERVMHEVNAIERESRMTKLRRTNVVGDNRGIWEDKCYGKVGVYKHDVLPVKLKKKEGVVVAEKELCDEEESTDCDSPDYDSIQTIFQLPPSIVENNPSVKLESSVRLDRDGKGESRWFQHEQRSTD